MNELIQDTMLPQIAREARKAAGLTQKEAGERLDVNQAAVSQAERDDSGSMVKLQLRMIRELAGWTIKGPFWELERSNPDT